MSCLTNLGDEFLGKAVIIALVKKRYINRMSKAVKLNYRSP